MNIKHNKPGTCLKHGMDWKMDSQTDWKELAWNALMTIEIHCIVKGVSLQYTLYYDLRLGSRSIFDFDHWLLAKISLECWPVSIYFRYIFVHYLLVKLWLLWQNSLTVVLHPKSALFDLSLWPRSQIAVQWLLEWHPLDSEHTTWSKPLNAISSRY